MDPGSPQIANDSPIIKNYGAKDAEDDQTQLTQSDRGFMLSKPQVKNRKHSRGEEKRYWADGGAG